MHTQVSSGDSKEAHTLAILWTRFEAHEKLQDERRAADKEALLLQAREYERRLQEANHAIKRADEKANDYVSRETYENKWVAHEEYEKAQDEKLASTQRLVFIGVGLLIAMELVLRFVA